MKQLHVILRKDKALFQDLFHVIDDSIGRKGKSVSQLRFARPTKKGWSFFRKKSTPWELLEDITHQTVKRHPHCHRAKIAETLSRLINLSDKELSALRLLL